MFLAKKKNCYELYLHVIYNQMFKFVQKFFLKLYLKAKHFDRNKTKKILLVPWQKKSCTKRLWCIFPHFPKSFGCNTLLYVMQNWRMTRCWIGNNSGVLKQRKLYLHLRPRPMAARQPPRWADLALDAFLFLSPPGYTWLSEQRSGSSRIPSLP